MPVSLDSITPKDGYLEVQFSGSRDGRITQYAPHLQPILQACEKYQCFRVLLDYTQMQYTVDTLVEHNAGEKLAQLLPPGIRMAYVAAECTEPHSSHFETVAVNRGASLRVFWDRQAALDWLLGKAPEAE